MVEWVENRTREEKELACEFEIEEEKFDRIQIIPMMRCKQMDIKKSES